MKGMQTPEALQYAATGLNSIAFWQITLAAYCDVHVEHNLLTPFLECTGAYKPR